MINRDFIIIIVSLQTVVALFANWFLRLNLLLRINTKMFSKMSFISAITLKNKGLIKNTTIICLSVLFFACDKVPKIANFDSVAWKNDMNGCLGDRVRLATILEPQRAELKMIEAPELIKVLGNPNTIEILQRQQRYYVYWIQNPANCADSTATYKEVRVRLSALGKVTEVLF